jgi:cell division protein ZapA
MKQLEVQIMGQSYMLTCPENGESHLRQAVARVDAAMCNIRDMGKVKSRDRIAVLAALNLTFELMPLEVVVAPAQETAIPEVAAPSPEKPDETGGKAPNPQLENLLQRLNTALGTNKQL